MMSTDNAPVPGTSQPVSMADYSGELLPYEFFWRDHQQWLEEKGYMLRPRYRPGWVPSWQGTDAFYWRFEDGISINFAQLMDAKRVSDGATVAIKRVSRKLHPYELDISQLFSTDPLAADPRNHCVPIYEVLQSPEDSDIILLVMPLLRGYNNPPLQTIGEAVEYFRQVFEGISFMHEHHVAHRDCMNMNIMMDPKPLFPRMYHPQREKRNVDFKGQAKYYTRTACPTKYYFIDFGLSRRYNPANGPPREYPIRGGDRTVPEFRDLEEPCDPFPTDIYYIGNMIREDFLQTFRGLDFMTSLVSDMVQDDPTQRPVISEVAKRFEVQSSTLGFFKLRSRLVRRDEFWVMYIFRTIRHVFRTISYVLTRRPAIPSP